MPTARLSLLRYAAMTATWGGDSQNATSGSTAWAGLAGRGEARQHEGGGRPGVGVVDWVLQACQVRANMLVGAILRPSSTGDIAVLFAGGCVMGTMPALKKPSMSLQACSAPHCDLAQLVSMWGLASHASPPLPLPLPPPPLTYPAQISLVGLGAGSTGSRTWSCHPGRPRCCG